MPRPNCKTTLAWLVSTALIAGCRGDVELLESRLRQQEEALAAADEKLVRQSAELAESRRSQWLLEQKVAEISDGRLRPEQVTLPARVDRIAIDRKFTAVRPLPEAAPARSLNLVFAPVGTDGAAVRIPGDFLVRLDYENMQSQSAVFEAEFSMEESLEHWQAALVGTGYQLELPVPADASTAAGQWSVEVEFRTSDGRLFEDRINLQVGHIQLLSAPEFRGETDGFAPADEL